MRPSFSDISKIGADGRQRNFGLSRTILSATSDFLNRHLKSDNLVIIAAAPTSASIKALGDFSMDARLIESAVTSQRSV
jgi:hypothetical protein